MTTFLDGRERVVRELARFLAKHEMNQASAAVAADVQVARIEREILEPLCHLINSGGIAA